MTEKIAHRLQHLVRQLARAHVHRLECPLQESYGEECNVRTIALQSRLQSRPVSGQDASRVRRR